MRYKVEQLKLYLALTDKKGLVRTILKGFSNCIRTDEFKDNRIKAYK